MSQCLTNKQREIIVDLFKNEIIIDSDSLELGEILIVYKLLMEDKSYKINNIPLKVYKFTDSVKTSANIEDFMNCIIIGGDLVLDEKDYNPYCSKFFADSLKTSKPKIYINAKKHCTQIIDVNYSYSFNKIYNGTITTLLPWHFADLKEETMIDIAQKAIGVGIEDVFLNLIKEHGIYRKLMTKELENIIPELIEQRTKNKKTEIEIITNECDELSRNLIEKHAKLRTIKYELAAIQMGINEETNPIKEIINFIENTSADIYVERVTDNTILELRINTVLSQWSENDYEVCIKNQEQSYFYTGVWTYSYNPELLKEFYKRIFETREYKIHVTTLIKFDFNRNMIKASGHSDDTHSKHPHLNDELVCFGNAKIRITDYLKDIRYLEALNAAIFAASQFTIYDVAAAKHLLQGMDQANCIELQNGKKLKATEVMELIKKEMEGTN